VRGAGLPCISIQFGWIVELQCDPSFRAVPVDPTNTPASLPRSRRRARVIPPRHLPKPLPRSPSRNPMLWIHPDRPRRVPSKKRCIESAPTSSLNAARLIFRLSRFKEPFATINSIAVPTSGGIILRITFPRKSCSQKASDSPYPGNAAVYP